MTSNTINFSGNTITVSGSSSFGIKQKVVGQQGNQVAGPKETPKETDGVWPSSKSKASSKELREKYKLTRRGCALIVSNLFNNPYPDIPENLIDAYRNVERMGAESHRFRWEKLFKYEFNCVTESHENVSSEVWPDILKCFKETAKDFDSCFILIMTHGKMDWLLMDDLKMIHLYNNLIAPFNRDNFVEFEEKPKIFFIQACKDPPEDFESKIEWPLFEERSNRGESRTTDGLGDNHNQGDNCGSRLYDDILEVSATAPMTEADRFLFLECCEQVFKGYRGKPEKERLDLQNMMKKVDEKMKGRIDHDQTLSVRSSGFNKDYHFYYGN